MRLSSWHQAWSGTVLCLPGSGASCSAQCASLPCAVSRRLFTWHTSHTRDLHARADSYVDPPATDLMAHRAFEACYHAIPYFGAFEKQADTHATLLQRYTTMRKRLESMVVRKGRSFARWTELTKYLGAWKSFVRRSVQKRLMDQVTQVRTAGHSPAGDATDSFICNPSHQAQRGSSRRGSGASKGRDYRSMSTNDFVATFVGMARETHSLVLFRLLDEVGIGLWQSVVTHLLGDKLDEQGALKALGSVSSCRQAVAGAHVLKARTHAVHFGHRVQALCHRDDITANDVVELLTKVLGHSPSFSGVCVF